ncbi:hypothetical protein GCM10010172_59450 [Paractinoplanes ferrugineus]|uniref:DUF308 domain-containing protein n=1 Tax=Paractinoplanes ferrugineus TaxID=113564 RepID=A0A919J6U9_9ACTN|nr:DUF308 domain-containing protein [Actinoplanes ferrugineus]GIE14407.1 hypothetical protein Afe05nite_62470 [Actinoplanes ferrugineus]
MTAGGARRGRRDNGIDAADFAVAGDVDPRIGEHLLDVLQAVGIGAYLQPTADLNPILRATTLPARPTDRLYVDRAHLDVAREHLHKVTGGAPPTPPPDPTAAPAREPDIEAEWAKIVAGFHAPVDPTAAPWPASEGLPAEPAPPPPPTGTDPVNQGRRRTDPAPADPNRADPNRADLTPADLTPAGPTPGEPTLIDGLDTFGADLEDDDEDEDERYVPPPPPPLPRISKYAVMGLLGVTVGFVLFLFPTLLPIAQDYATVLGFAAIVSGAAMLVWRLRSGDDEDDDYDDGAVV